MKKAGAKLQFGKAGKALMRSSLHPQVTSIRSIKLHQTQVNHMRAEQVTRGGPMGPGKLFSLSGLRFTCAGAAHLCEDTEL